MGGRGERGGKCKGIREKVKRRQRADGEHVILSIRVNWQCAIDRHCAYHIKIRKIEKQKNIQKRRGGRKSAASAAAVLP